MKTPHRTWLTVGAAGGLLAALAAAYARGRHPIGNPSVPEPAKPVELERYLGRWFEIARYEQRFQKGCAGVTADYGLRADGSIEVVNRCRKDDGRIAAIRGRATVADPATRAKLKVRFFGPIAGDYWILDHADDYSWSIVGEGSGRYLWLLHRSPTPSGSEVSALFARAEALGYDTSQLLRTIQP